MTSPVATIGLTYDGSDLQTSDLQIFLQIVHGLNEPPSVRGVDYVVPVREGRVEANRVNDVLSIVLEGHVRGDPSQTTTSGARSTFRNNAQTIRALFAPNRARADLVATLEDGTIVSISARPLNAVWSEPVPSEFAAVSIELEGYDDWAEVVGS